jgi:hypothetical protein
MKFTDITINITTTDSTAIASAVWTGSAHAAGRLLVRYRSSAKVYAFAAVPLEGALALLEALDEGESLGSTMHRVLKGRAAVAA